MSYIGAIPTVGNFQVCDAISVVNGQAAYTLQVGGVNITPESANHMLVSLNGILQKPGSSFTVSGSTMTFASNLATGDVIDFVQILGNVLDIGQPSDDTVKTASIQANAVTAAKLNNDIISGTTALTSAPDDTDEFLVSDAGTLKRIDYSLIKGGGQYTKILHTTASSSANVAFNSTYLTSTYQDYKIVFSNVHCATDAQRLFLEVSSDNGSSFKTLDLNVLGRKDDGSQIHSKNSNDDSEANLQVQMNEDIGNDAGLHISGELDIFDPSGTDNRKLILGRSGSNVGDSALAFFYSIFGAMTKDTDAINYVKFSWGSGNIASGEFTLYGRKIT